MTTQKSIKTLKDALKKTKDDKQALSKTLSDVVKQIDLLQSRKQDLNAQIDDLNDTIDQLNTDINADIPT